MRYNINGDSINYNSGKGKGKAVRSERYSNMIGYAFGAWVYNGAAYSDNCRQYVFIANGDDPNEKAGSVLVVDYKGFRSIVDRYNFPARKVR